MTDRAAVMREAWRHWRYARSKGWHLGDDDVWTWARCLRFAATQARARRPSGFEAVEAAMAEIMGEENCRASPCAAIRYYHSRIERAGIPRLTEPSTQRPKGPRSSASEKMGLDQ